MKQILRVLTLLCLATGVLQAQQPSMQFFRPWDQSGLNIFEPSKLDTVLFTGKHVRIGGAFTQDYQALTASNYVATSGKLPKVDSANILDPLTGGFNLAMADMYIDAQLDDGLRANVTVYLSAKHHNEAWVKNGYVQIDKLGFLHMDALNDIMKSLTIKVGDLEVDYGDQHYRRVDGGNSMFNPFTENYIMDEFATEIGAEFLYHPLSNHIIAMVGVTDGMLNPTVVDSKYGALDSVTKSPNAYQPAYHFKVGYDNQINPDLRLRLTASMYIEGSTSSSTLFGGDRTGSHYFLVLEPLSATTTGNAFSGRFNPGFSDQVSTFMINPFVKFDGFEFFGTYESAKGRKINETAQRNATQMAADVLYRFGASENFWVGARYNSVKADLYQTPTTSTPVTINRIVGSLGWFVTQNLMMKAEYVTQSYNDYPGGTGVAGTSILKDGKFSGVMIEAVLGF